MRTIIATTNPATLNFAQAVLKSEGIETFIMDQNMSLMEGSIGIIPRRLCVIDEDYGDAVEALTAAELGHEIEPYN